MIQTVNSVSSPCASLTLPQKVLSMPTTRNPGSLLKGYYGSGQNSDTQPLESRALSGGNHEPWDLGNTVLCSVKVTTVCLDTPPSMKTNSKSFSWRCSQHGTRAQEPLTSRLSSAQDYRPPSTDISSSVPSLPHPRL